LNCTKYEGLDEVREVGFRDEDDRVNENESIK
jgi:hypothetical protein